MSGYYVRYKNDQAQLTTIEAWFLYEDDARDWVSGKSFSHSDDTDVRIEESDYEIQRCYHISLNEV